jgi:hypothetical protein
VGWVETLGGKDQCLLISGAGWLHTYDTVPGPVEVGSTSRALHVHRVLVEKILCNVWMDVQSLRKSTQETQQHMPCDAYICYASAHFYVSKHLETKIKICPGQ